MKRIALALALALGPAPALAHHSAEHERAAPVRVSRERAAAIAAEQGVTRVREIELRRGRWKVEGFAADGRVIEVEIDAQTGAVLKREIE